MTSTTVDERAGLPSASNWRRYELCHGSYQLEQKAREKEQLAHSEPTQASARGERIHEGVIAGTEIALARESEATSAEFLKQRALEQIKRIFGDNPIKELIEERLWMKAGGQEVASGRVDRLIWSESVALVIDYKTGWIEPDPAQVNSQLKVLAVLAALNLPDTITRVVVQIISGPYGVSECEYTLGDLARAYREIIITLKAINDPHAKPIPGREQCRYCPALNICPKVEEMLGPITQLHYYTLPTGPDATNLLDKVEIVQNYLDEIRAHYSRLLETAPDSIPEYGLVQSAPRRTVTDWLAARARLEEFVDKSKLDSLLMFSIPSVEKIIGKEFSLKGNALKAKLAEILGSLLELKFPEPSLKRVNGKPKITEL